MTWWGNTPIHLHFLLLGRDSVRLVTQPCNLTIAKVWQLRAFSAATSVLKRGMLVQAECWRTQASSPFNNAFLRCSWKSFGS